MYLVDKQLNILLLKHVKIHDRSYVGQMIKCQSTLDRTPGRKLARNSTYVTVCVKSEEVESYVAKHVGSNARSNVTRNM